MSAWSVKPTRRTQPFRKGGRTPGTALSAATRGRTLYGSNPMDLKRATMKRKRRRKRGALTRAASR